MRAWKNPVCRHGFEAGLVDPEPAGIGFAVTVALRSN
jgi:hypothetical protein